jgi:histidinol phosphatase-like enzyme
VRLDCKRKDAKTPSLKDDLILDRDGTLNVERNYLSQLDRVELLPGPVEV